MSGIAAYGVKIPKRRLSADEIFKVWKAPSKEIIEKLGMKERTVTGPDEDCISLGCDAAVSCIEQAGIKVSEIDGLIFATCTNPYSLKASATVLQDALGISKHAFVTDVQFSGRGGLDAIKIAKALVDAKQAKNVLVIAADTLNIFMSPGHVYDYAAAAGAVAVLISNKNVIAEINAMEFVSEDRANWYKLANERYIQLGSGFVGYISNWGLMDSLKDSWRAFSKRNKCTAEDFGYFALPQGTMVQTFMSSGAIGCDVYSAIPYILTEQVGDMGCAGVLACLCNILDLIDDAGEKVLVAAYGWGDGSGIMSLTTTEKLGSVAGRPVVLPQLDKKEMIDYAKALKYEKKLDRNLKGLSSYY